MRDAFGAVHNREIDNEFLLEVDFFAYSIRFFFARHKGDTFAVFRYLHDAVFTFIAKLEGYNPLSAAAYHYAAVTAIGNSSKSNSRLDHLGWF